MVDRTLISLSVVIVSLIVFLIYCSYLYDRQMRIEINEPYFIRKIRNAKRSEQYSGKRILRPLVEQNISYSVWLNVNDWDYKKSEFKHVFHQGTYNADRCLPGVWLAPNVNDIIITFETDEIRNYFEHKLGYPRYLENILTQYKSGNITSDTNVEIFKNRVLFNNEVNLENYVDTKNYQEILNSYSSSDEIVLFVEDNQKLTNSTIPYMYVVVHDKTKLRENMGNDRSHHKLMKNFDNPVLDVFDSKNNNILAYTVKKTNTMESLNPSRNSRIVDDKSIRIENFPLNRWFHLVIVIKDLYVNVYLDSYLVKSFGFKGLITYNNGDLFVTQNGGFGGLITQLRYHNRELLIDEIKEKYYVGPQAFLFPALNRSLYSLNIDPDSHLCGEDDTSISCLLLSNVSGGIDPTSVDEGKAKTRYAYFNKNL